MKIYGLKNHLGNYELCLIGGHNFPFEFEGEETDLPITEGKASDLPKVGEVVAVNGSMSNFIITKTKDMQPEIFNPDNKDNFTETAPFIFCNKELQKTSKQDAVGIQVTFEDGTKGFYPKAHIKNWDLL